MDSMHNNCYKQISPLSVQGIQRYGFCEVCITKNGTWSRDSLSARRITKVEDTTTNLSIHYWTL